MADSSELELGEEVESSLLEVEDSEKEDEDSLEVNEGPELKLDNVLARCEAFRP